MEHELKVMPEYFRSIKDGTKTFELRNNDRDFRIGDTLRLREWNHGVEYTGQEVSRRVVYKLEGFGGLKACYCMLGLERTCGVDVEPVKNSAGDTYNLYYCALCGEHLILTKAKQLPNYCPNCGARIVREDEDA